MEDKREPLTPAKAMLLLFHCFLEKAILEKDHEALKHLRAYAKAEFSSDWSVYFAEAERSLMARENPKEELEQIIEMLMEYLDS